MNPYSDVAALVAYSIGRLTTDGRLPAGLDLARTSVDPPRDPAFGEMACNAAMILAKPAKMPPGKIAELLSTELEKSAVVQSASVAKPGFINLRLTPDFWLRRITDVLSAGARYGASTVGGDAPVNVEFCSANPTGRLHVGHGRGTVFGDALASLLSFAGWNVTREYYINDGGAQITILARSVHIRYREILGDHIGVMPEGLYPSPDLIPVAREIADCDGRKWLDHAEDAWLRRFSDAAINAMMGMIKEDLAALGVRYDRFSSERDLIENGRLDAALDLLRGKGLLYSGKLPPPKGKKIDDWEPVELLLFKSTEFGDDIDRPLQNSSGAWTYLAADIAYHFDKIRRGTPTLIDIWGADHGGYIKRLQAAVRAYSSSAHLDVRVCQLVNLMDEGKPLKMSKRAGRIANLKDVIAEVGKDVFRFMILFRKNDAPLDFDLHKVTETSRDNPVFYVQYAHARICSVFRNAEAEGISFSGSDLGAADLSLLTDEYELKLVRRMASFPRIIENSAVQLEPHRVGFYLHEIAGDFHSLWNRGKENPAIRFLAMDDTELTRARLAMLVAVRQVLRNGMSILGVDPVEELVS